MHTDRDLNPKKANTETPRGANRSEENTSRNVHLKLPPSFEYGTISKDNTTRNSKLPLLLVTQSNEAFASRALALSLPKKSLPKPQIENPDNIISGEPVLKTEVVVPKATTTKGYDKSSVIFIPNKLLLPVRTSQTNFYSFGKLVRTHRNEIKNFDHGLIDDYHTRSDLEKQLDFNRAQERVISQGIQKLQKDKIKYYDGLRKEISKKEQKMPKIKVYPSRFLLAQQGLKIGMEDESVNPESEQNNSKNENLEVVKIVSSENINSLLTKQLKFFKYRNFETVEWRPEGREAATFISNGRHGYLFGGMSQNLIPYMEVLDAGKWSWTKIEPKGEVPEGRLGHSACYYQKGIIIFGGEKKYNSNLRMRECLNDVYSFSIEKSSWSKLNCFGDTMEPRRNHISAVVGKHMLVYGGVNSHGELLSDLKALSFANMKWISCFEEGNPDVAVAFHAATLVLHPEHQKFSLYKSKPLVDPGAPIIKEEGLYIFGGKDEFGAVLNTLRILKLGQKPLKWIVPETVGQPPAPRYQHTMNYYEALNCIIIYGGRNDRAKFLGDISVLYLENLTWMTAVVYGNAIQPRFSHCAAVIGSKLCVFGGMNFRSYLGSDVEIIELDQGTAIERYREGNDFLIKKDHLLPDIGKKVTYKDDILTNLLPREEEHHQISSNVVSFLPLPTKEELKKQSMTEADTHPDGTPVDGKYTRKNRKKLMKNFSSALGQALAHIPKNLKDTVNSKRTEKRRGSNA